MPKRPRTVRRAALSGVSVAASIVVLGPIGATAAAPTHPTAARTSTQSATDHRPATVSSVQVPAAAAAPQAKGRLDAARTVLTRLPARRTTDFGMVGVTWKEGTGTGTVSAQVRTLSKGTWSTWSTLEVDENGAESTRAGTEAMWVGSADGVAAQVRSTGGVAPQAVDVELVNPGTDPGRSLADRSAAAGAAVASDGSPSYTAKPAWISRASWGARANTTCDSPRYGPRTTGVIFHHTADSNSYTKAQSKSIVRATQAYHMQSRGWCDIGYNFLVDKYGQIFEGRSGGAGYQVRGAHAGNTIVNTYDMGVSMMGNLDTARPTAAMESAAVGLIGWRLGTNYLPAKGTYSIAGHTLNRIAGHRDVYNSGIRPATATACPGRYGYAWLTAAGGLRDRVAAYIKNYRTAIKTKAAQLGHAYTGYVRVGEYPTDGGHKTLFGRGDMYAKGSLGAHFVYGVIYTEYNAWNIQNGALGFPAGDISIAVSGGRASQRFEHGTIYRVPQSGGGNRAFGLTAGVDNKYRSLGGYTSRLRSPTTRASYSGGVDRAKFQGGTIAYNRSTRQSTVTYY